MARINLDHIRHAYSPAARAAGDYALKEVHHEWDDGGAYALLGPSGCGKTTLLNIISGLLHPSDGRIEFDGVDVTNLPTAARNIAQVFQFPVESVTALELAHGAAVVVNQARCPVYCQCQCLGLCIVVA